MRGTLEGYSLVQTTAPVIPAISVAEAALHTKVEEDELTADTNLITDLIAAAVQRCERVTGQALVTQTWTLKTDGFPLCGRSLPWSEGISLKLIPPLASVSSITYIATDGTSTVLATSGYQVDTGRARVAPAYGAIWPSTRDQLAAVTLVFVAGQTTAAAVAPEIRERLKAYVAYCYWNREERDEQMLDRFFEGLWTGRI